MLEDYLQELQKIALLQPEEEAALWQAYKAGISIPISYSMPCRKGP